MKEKEWFNMVFLLETNSFEIINLTQSTKS